MMLQDSFDTHWQNLHLWLKNKYLPHKRLGYSRTLGNSNQQDTTREQKNLDHSSCPQDSLQVKNYQQDSNYQQDNC